MKKYLFFAISLFFFAACKKKENSIQNPLPNIHALIGTNWLAIRRDELDFAVEQKLSFITDSTGEFSTQDYRLSSGYVIKGFKEPTIWYINKSTANIHFDHEKNYPFPNDLQAHYEWENDTSVLNSSPRLTLIANGVVYYQNK